MLRSCFLSNKGVLAMEGQRDKVENDKGRWRMITDYAQGVPDGKDLAAQTL